MACALKDDDDDASLYLAQEKG